MTGKIPVWQVTRPKSEQLFQKDGWRNVPSARPLAMAPHILWQDILDTQETVSYTADNEKQVLINPVPKIMSKEDCMAVIKSLQA